MLVLQKAPLGCNSCGRNEAGGHLSTCCKASNAAVTTLPSLAWAKKRHSSSTAAHCSARQPFSVSSRKPRDVSAWWAAPACRRATRTPWMVARGRSSFTGTNISAESRGDLSERVNWWKPYCDVDVMEGYNIRALLARRNKTRLNPLWSYSKIVRIKDYQNQLRIIFPSLLKPFKILCK